MGAILPVILILSVLNGVPVSAAVTATASSEQGDELSARQAVDGDLSTRWSSSFADYQWLEIDCGGNNTLTGLLIQWESAYALKYNVLVAHDRSDWRNVFATDTGDGGKDEITFAPVTGRYIRINCLRRATDWGNSIYDISIFGFAGGQEAGVSDRLLDNFEQISDWKPSQDNATLTLVSVPGRTNHALKLDFNFPNDAGWVVAGRDLNLKLPADYSFSFYVKGTGPANRLEFKVSDPAGNYYWKIWDTFTFPVNWQKITITQNDLVFAWGPSAALAPTAINRVEFAIAAKTGGRGQVQIDDFYLQQKSGQLWPLNASTAIDGIGYIATDNPSNRKLEYYYYLPGRCANNRKTEVPVLVCVPGLGVRGENFSAVPFLKKLAADKGMLLIAPTFTHNESDFNQQRSYQFPAAWSGEALTQIVKKTGEANKIKPGRYYLLGFSAGAQFALRFSLWRQDLCAAVAAHASGASITPSYGFPMHYLLTVGGNDLERISNMKNFYNAARNQHMDATYKEYPGKGHEYPDEIARDAVQFFSSLIK